MTGLHIKLERTTIRPGDTIHGEASWQLSQPATQLEVRLFWYTEGKGDRDLEVVETLIVPSASSAGNYAFEIQAPLAPISFSGKLISLIWAVELVASPSADAARQELVLSHLGREIRLPVAP